MTIEEKRRELFQSVYPADGYALDHYGFYSGPWASYYSARWEAFNAALDAVVIKRPSLEYEMHAEIKMRARFQDAIESTGLGLKVKS